MGKYSDFFSSLEQKAQQPDTYIEIDKPAAKKPAKAEPTPKQPETESRSVLKDAAGLWGVGAGSLVKGAGWLFGSDELQRLGQNTAEYWERTLSDTQREANQKRFVTDDWELGEAATDPNAYFGAVVQSLPHMVPGIGAAGAVGRGALAMGLSRKAASAGAATAGSMGEGVTIGAMVGQEVDEAIRGMSEEEKRQSPYYADLRELYSEEEATQRLSDLAANPAALKAGVVGGALGVAFNKFLGDALTRRLSGGPVKEGAKGGLIEGGTEVLQSGYEAHSRQSALNEYAAQPMNYTDMVNEMVTGLAAGTVLGTGVGAAGGLQKQPDNTQQVNRRQPESAETAERMAQARQRARQAGGDALDETRAAADELARIQEELAARPEAPAFDQPEDVGGLLSEAMRAQGKPLADAGPQPIAPEQAPVDIAGTAANMMPEADTQPQQAEVPQAPDTDEVVYDQDGVRVTRTDRGFEAQTLTDSGQTLTEFGQDPDEARRRLTRRMEQTQPKEAVLQNRDRSRPAYVEQMQAIANEPDYDRVSVSRDPNTGAPMVFERRNNQAPDTEAPVVWDADKGNTDTVTMSDGQGGTRKVPVQYAVVEADSVTASNNADGSRNDAYGEDGLTALNNGRTAGLQAAFQKGNAEPYVDALLADPAHGIAPEAIRAKKNPLLVRLFDESALEGIDDPGAASNVSANAELSAVEQAQTDARKLDTDMLGEIVPGDVTGPNNMDFVRRFTDLLGKDGQGNALRDAKGLLTAQGQKRIKGALVERAYHDPTITQELTEAVDNDLKTLGDALAQAAGRWALMRERAREGSINPDMDITDALVSAVNMIRKSRQEGTALADLAGQVDAFAGPADRMAVEILHLFYHGEKFGRIRAKDTIAQTLLDYVDAALAAAPEPDMFGQMTTPQSALEAQRGQTQDTQNARRVQPDGADDREAGPAGERPERGSSGQADAEEGPGSQQTETIEAAAQQADTNPTDGQKEAGNYQKGHLTLHGLNISIENPKGSTRSGTDPDGNRWERELTHHYGYMKGTIGADGDHVDVFIGPNPESEAVFIVDQTNPDGTFDEHKVMLGFNNKLAARRGYASNYEKGWKVGPITETTLDELKLWLDQGEANSPFVRYAADNELHGREYPDAEKFADMEESEDRFDPAEDWDYEVTEAHFPEPETSINATSEAGDYLPVSGSEQIVESWRKVAERLGRTQDNSNKVILSLFDESGEISEPWRLAGYDVRQYDIKLGDDLQKYVPTADLADMRDEGKEIVGIIAQPPCTCFSSSGARWWKKRHDKHDRDMVDRMFGPEASKWFSKPKEYTKALVSIVDLMIGWAKADGNLQFHVLENPVGRIAKELGMPAPLLRFHPHVYGDPYTKQTQLWGDFNTDLPTANTIPAQGGLMHQMWSSAEKGRGERSITPKGFAYAFFMANAQGADAVQAVTVDSAQRTPLSQRDTQATLDYIANTVKGRAMAMKVGELRKKAEPVLKAAGVSVPEKGNAITKALTDFDTVDPEQLAEAFNVELTGYANKALALRADNEPATDDGFDLEAQSEEQLAEQERQQQEAEQAEAQTQREEEQRAQADEEAKDFVLTGSNSRIDQAEARGQGNMFDVMGQPDTEPEPEPEPEPQTTYRDRWRDRQQRLNRATTESEVQAILDEDAADPELNPEGHEVLKTEAMIAREEIKAGRRSPEPSAPAKPESRRTFSKQDDRTWKSKDGVIIRKNDSGGGYTIFRNEGEMIRNQPFKEAGNLIEARGSAQRVEVAPEAPSQPQRPSARRRGKPELHDALADLTEQARNLPITIRPNDVSYQLAHDAYAGMSHVPDDRALQEQIEYMQEMIGLHEQMAKLANTEEKQQTLADELRRYKDNYLKRNRAVLQAKSRTLSPMITGGSNFPSRRNQKRLDTEQRRIEEFLAWRGKARNAIRRALTPEQAPISSTDSDAITKLRKKLEGLEQAQERMKAGNKIVRRKKLSDDEKIQRLQDEANLSKTQAKELLKPDFAGRLGFPSYALSNNNAEIRRVKQRIQELEARQETSEQVGGLVTAEFEGGTVELDYKSGYVRIMHDEKPSAEVRQQLKTNGFRWTPSETAWRRKLNNQAIYRAKQITGVEIPEQSVADGAELLYRKNGVPYYEVNEDQLALDFDAEPDDGDTGDLQGGQGGQSDAQQTTDAGRRPARVQALQKTRHIERQTFLHGLQSVNTAAEAAHVLAPFRKDAHETMLGLVLDKERRPLAIIRHSKGTVDGAGVYPGQFVADISSVPGAEAVWLSHNHPSGVTEPSQADVNITNILAPMLADAEISLQGHVVIGFGRAMTSFAITNPSREFQRTIDSSVDRDQQTVAAPRKHRIPVLERQVFKKSGEDLPVVREPANARRALNMVASPEQTGLMLLDNRHRPVGFLDLTGYDLEALRDNGAYRNVLEAMAQTNASAAIIQAGKGVEDTSNLQRMVAEFGNDLRLLDAVHVDRIGTEKVNYQSLAERGLVAQGGAWFSRDGTYRRSPNADIDALTVDEAQKAVKALMKGWKSKPAINVADRISEFPRALRTAIREAGAESDMRAVFWGGEVYVLAPRIPNKSALQEVILHEVIGHYGLREMMGNDLKPLLSRVYMSMGNSAQANVLKRIYFPGDRFDPQNAKHRMTIAEELIAHLAESNQHQKLWNRIKSAIRDGLRKLGFTLDLNETDILNLLRGAQRTVAQGGISRPSEFDSQFRRAYHGTPHRFDRFSLEAIGTGEGAQAFGWGLYFAGNKEVAEFYREALTKQRTRTTSLTDNMESLDVDGEPLLENYPVESSERLVEYAKKGENTAAAFHAALSAERWKELAKDGDYPFQDYAREKADAWQRLSEDLDDGKKLSSRATGNLYEVEIPDDNELLDWDRPLSDQPPGITEAVRAVTDSQWGEGTFDAWLEANPEGGDFREWSDNLMEDMSDQEISMALAERGVPGLRYLDGASRYKPIKQIKREFLEELPENADIEEVEELIGTGTFSPKNEAVVRALQADDWLGFEFPAQAISVALSRELSRFDPSPDLRRSVNALKEDGDRNYVIWDEDVVTVQAVNDELAQAEAYFSRAGQGEDQPMFSRAGARLDHASEHFTDLSDDQRSALNKIAPRTPRESAREWLSERTDRWQTKLRQGMVDRYAALMDVDEAVHGKDVIENSTASSSWVLAQMAGAASGSLQAMLTEGRIWLDTNEKVIKMQEGSTKGLNETLKQLGSAAEIERFFGWIAGNRSRKLMEQDRENLFEPEEVEALASLNQGRTDSGANRSELYDRVFEEFQQFRDDVLQIADAAGLLRKGMEEDEAILFLAQKYDAGTALAERYKKAQRKADTAEDEDERDMAAARAGELYAQLHDVVADAVENFEEEYDALTTDQRDLWANEFYVPFYRVTDSEGGIAGPTPTSGLSRQQAYKRLKGGTQNLNDLLENTMMNFHHLLQASLKNQAAEQAIKNAEALGIARRVTQSSRDPENSTFVLEEGVKSWYEVDDPLVFKAVTALAHPGMNSTAMKVMRGFKRLFTNMTTTTPQFVIANLLRDSMQASATSEVSKNILKNMAEGSKAYGNKRTRARMMASGGSFSFGHLYGENADEVRLQLTGGLAKADVLRTPSMVPAAIRGVWRRWNEITDFTENVNRAAIFEQNRQRKGDLYAAFKARDLMNFSQYGAWPAMRILIDVVPFLNARLQGLDKIYRSGVKPGIRMAFGQGGATDRQAMARFWTVTGALGLASMALFLKNRDDEEFKKLEEWQKDTYWFLRTGEDSAIFIPKPFEVGAIATLVERLTEQAVSDTATGDLFAERLGHMVMDTFSFSPVPQMFQPALDVYANYDAFTDRPIESMGMERLSPSLRARGNTTSLAKGLSKATESAFGDDGMLTFSPVQIDHMIQGYFGAVGAWVAGVGDTIWKTANGETAPDKHWYEYQPVKRFYKNLGDEDRYTRYGTVFYDALKEANRVYADIKEYQELGQLETAIEVLRKNRQKLAMRRTLNRVQRQLSKINQRMQQVYRMPGDSEYKRRELDRLRAMRNRIQGAVGQRLEQISASAS